MESPKSTTSFKPRPIKVLLVEEDMSYAHDVEYLLSREKGTDLFELRCANDSFSALEQLGKEEMDVILIDISFPPGVGLQILDRLHQVFSSVPKLVLIEADDQPLALEAMNHGAKGYLLKLQSDETAIPHAVLTLTRQIEAEKALRKSETFFRTLIENSADIITILDEKGTVQYASPSYERILGREPQAFLGKNIFECVHADDLEKFKEVLREYFEHPHKTGPVVRFRFLHSDGSWVYLEAVGQVILNDEGQKRCIINSHDVTGHVTLASQLRNLSLVDELTGLHNRRSFMMIASQEIKKADRLKLEKIYLIFTDMDNLKWINDNMGHSEGDRALKGFAQILVKNYRSMDLMARIGGDEFVVLITDAPEEDAEKIAGRLKANVDAWDPFPDKNHKVSVSMGIVHYDPNKPCSVEELLARADQLMYAQKRGKSGPQKKYRPSKDF